MGNPQGGSGLEENVAKFSDLWYPIPAAFVVICFRLFFERYVYDEEKKLHIIF